ncbi:MAG: transcriptional repressor [Thiohalomonadales bacterium]
MIQAQRLLKQEESPIVNLLRAKGIEPTAIRVEVAEALLEKIQHLTLSQIRNRLHRWDNMVSDEGIVNILRLFEKHKLLREVYIDSKTVYYDSNSSVHPHFYNAITGELVDVLAKEICVTDSNPR